MLPKRKTMLLGIFNKFHQFLNFHESSNCSLYIVLSLAETFWTDTFSHASFQLNVLHAETEYNIAL